MDITTILTQQLNQLLQYFNLNIIFIGLGITEIAKKFLPDNIEGKWIPVIAVVSCVGLAFAFKASNALVVGLCTGILISGGYSALMNFIKSIGTGNGNPTPPAPPVNP